MENGKDKRAYLNEAYTPDELEDSKRPANGQASTGKLPSYEQATALSIEDDQAKDKEGKEAEEVDPWALPELKSTDTPWAELTPPRRVLRVIWYIARFFILLGLLYMFICSLDILSSAFNLLGGKAAGEALSNTVLFSNPIAGMMLGVLATVLVQSSSTSTSIVVSMVSAGLLNVGNAIPMMMGANIGTTVTNTIVAMGQSADRGDFRRAFAAATVHDMFNWLSVLVFLPLEWVSGYLRRLTTLIVQNIPDNTNTTAENPEFLKAITKPLTERVVLLDTSKIRQIALGQDINGSLIKDGDHIFNGWTGSDAASGGILLAASLLLLCVCLVLIVKLLTSLLKGAIATLLQRFINSDLPGPFKYLTGCLAILVGAGMTILVQSSSIFTSAITPLVGIGAIHIDRMYPLTLGSNIGTTVTGILAALASDPTGFKNSFQVALCHLFFNISGILVWYPVPCMRKIPISLAKVMGQTVFKYRWFALCYLVLLYFLVPLAVFGLSLAGWEVLLGVGLPIFVFIVVIVIINVLQTKKPEVLPAKLRSWEATGLPEPLRSLAPIDRVFQRMRGVCTCCKTTPEADDLEAETIGQGQRNGSVKKDTEQNGHIESSRL